MGNESKKGNKKGLYLKNFVKHNVQFLKSKSVISSIGYS